MIRDRIMNLIINKLDKYSYVVVSISSFPSDSDFFKIRCFCSSIPFPGSQEALTVLSQLAFNHQFLVVPNQSPEYRSRLKIRCFCTFVPSPGSHGAL